MLEERILQEVRLPAPEAPPTEAAAAEEGDIFDDTPPQSAPAGVPG